MRGGGSGVTATRAHRLLGRIRPVATAAVLSLCAGAGAAETGAPGPVRVLTYNESSDDAAVKTLLEAHFVDACTVKGAACRASWPGPTSPWPAVARIDLVLGRGVRFTAAQVPDGGGSDHRPMTAAFVLTGR